MKKIVAGVGLFSTCTITLVSMIISLFITNRFVSYSGFRNVFLARIEWDSFASIYILLLILALAGIGLIIWGIISKEK